VNGTTATAPSSSIKITWHLPTSRLPLITCFDIIMVLKSFLSWSAAGLTGATVTVVATTIDDAVWLVPYVGSRRKWSWSARIVHALLFVATLEGLSMASVLVAWIIAATTTSSSSSSSGNPKRDEIILGSIGAALCWGLAIFFFVQKWLKKRRRQLQREQQQQQQAEERAPLTTSSSEPVAGGGAAPYDSVTPGESEPTNDADPKSTSCGTMLTIVSLTTLGALDEVSYFPALVVGGIFSPLEICLGTMLAAVLILLVVTCFLSQCKPLVECLDRIPVYAVIAVFATVLTCGVLYDVLLEGKEED